MILYAALALVLLPWATEPGMANPRITAVAGAAVLIANLCTAVLLGSWYWSTGRPAVLILACGYLWGGIMAGLHMTTFPGALFPEPLFGGEHTVGWLYVAWRGGAAGSYLVAVPGQRGSEANFTLASCMK